MTTKNKPNETHAEMIERLRGVLAKLRERFDTMPSGGGVGLFLQIKDLERRIKREEIHALSGYRTPRRPVSGGAPGSNRRK
ncbi:hypothetical protein [Pseudomonas aeruginosa]|uniref:hypothetical protein n=1 Tax=Pseudomonas aeruginosa TaxID=287 RepID=UPI000F843EEA|nr:hypothetical protein [Pseudomonas aeruginosa]EKU0448227.1 hypothetical protein [Pseudomonas aeruginosa]EKU9157409.1 hypothetical protein [Pseudomonas aeruginosa]EKW2599025.1 hypothetical protein [Pseudomonas aeruginosa]ELC8894707.1 hypothetical protein [Pseudomonas aeruginosa]ELM5333913.1 hypothetical protein [Pseudomonas aeruginosa]